MAPLPELPQQCNTVNMKVGFHMDKAAEDFIREQTADRIDIKSAVMELAARRRNLNFRRIDRRIITVDMPSGQTIAFRKMNGVFSSEVGRYFCDQKERGRDLLRRANLPVTPSRVFRRRGFDSALEYAMGLGGPSVIKPTNLARGRGISTNVDTEEKFSKAWDKAFAAYRNPTNARVLVEKQIAGEDFRLYVIGQSKVFATHRRRASVTGDGESSIIELIQQKNAVRSQNPYLGSYLIPEDPEKLDRLEPAGLDLNNVPDAGRVITLRGASNLSAGGDSIDFTDTMHPGFRDIAIQAVAATPGVEYAGVDIITPSITADPKSVDFVVSEVEFSPAPITLFPAEGTPQDMGGELLEYYIARI